MHKDVTEPGITYNKTKIIYIVLFDSPQIYIIYGLYAQIVLLHVMSANDMKLEDMIIPTKWTDRDAEIVVQSEIDNMLGLEPVMELD